MKAQKMKEIANKVRVIHSREVRNQMMFEVFTKITQAANEGKMSTDFEFICKGEEQRCVDILWRLGYKVYTIGNVERFYSITIKWD